ncbi:MAG: cysteine desulfurase [Bdellovibrionota bacterium]
MAYDVERIRGDFPVLARTIRERPLVYLDNAASTLKPNAVIERMDRYYRFETSNVHRGAHYLAEQGTISYEAAREAVRDFVNAKNSNEIIFTRGTTESINLVAHAWGETNLKPGDEIVLSEVEHHSNIVPWQIVAKKTGAVIKVIPVLENGELDFDSYVKLVGPKTKMVSITWCSNVLGTVVPVEKFIDVAHANGALVTIDGAQGVSNLKTDLQAMKCDFFAFSSHKLFGPYGIGALFGRAELLEEMEPYQGGGSMIADVSWEKTTWAAVPHKFEAGTPSIADAIGLGTAIRYVQSLGLDEIHRHEQDLLTYATRKIESIPGVKIVGKAAQKCAILSFTMEGAHPSDIGSIIDQQGVAIRAGHHCCQPLMKRFGIPATARASFSIYNTRSEVDALVESLIKAKEFF